MTPRDIGARVRLAARGRSMASIARQAGVTERTLQHIAAGSLKAGTRVDTLEAVARALGVAPGWLAFGEPEPPTP